MKSKVKDVLKEEIEFLNFPKEEVLEQNEDRKIRIQELKRALSLGNLEKEKVKIYFADDSGLKRVETTIWAVTETSVVLKKSAILPLQRIIAVA